MYRFLVVFTLLAACGGTESVDVEASGPDPEAAPVDLAFCDGEPFADAAGQPVSGIQASLPDKARVLEPDSIATQDYRIDRLNVFVDENGIVQRLTCG